MKGLTKFTIGLFLVCALLFILGCIYQAANPLGGVLNSVGLGSAMYGLALFAIWLGLLGMAAAIVLAIVCYVRYLAATNPGHSPRFAQPHHSSP